jgi:hypothetical protein
MDQGRDRRSGWAGGVKVEVVIFDEKAVGAHLQWGTHGFDGRSERKWREAVCGRSSTCQPGNAEQKLRLHRNDICTIGATSTMANKRGNEDGTEAVIVARRHMFQDRALHDSGEIKNASGCKLA